MCSRSDVFQITGNAFLWHLMKPYSWLSVVWKKAWSPVHNNKFSFYWVHVLVHLLSFCRSLWNHSFEVILLEDKQKVVACSLLQRCRARVCEVTPQHGMKISVELKSVSRISGLNSTWSGCFPGVHGVPEQQTGAQVSTPCCNGHRFKFLSAWYGGEFAGDTKLVGECWPAGRQEGSAEALQAGKMGWIQWYEV